MKYIGLVDDRKTTRDSLKLSIKAPIIKDGISEWDIIDIAPFEEKADFISWIHENDISVLIIDEKLNESQIVDYLGHDVVKLLRSKFNELPIFCITAYSRENDLNENYKNYNFIISKNEFDNKRDEYVNLFLKSGEDFYQKYSQKKDRLAELSAKVSSLKNQEASKEDLQEIQTLQEFLSLSHVVSDEKTNELWLNEFNLEVSKFDELIERIKKNI